MRVVAPRRHLAAASQNWLASSIRHLPPPAVSSTVVSRSPCPRMRRRLRHVPASPTARPGARRSCAGCRVLPELEPGRLARRMGLRYRCHPCPFRDGGLGTLGRAGPPPRTTSSSASTASTSTCSREGSRRWRRRYERVFEDAAMVLALGPWMSDRLALTGADPARIAVHHLGVPSFRRRIPTALVGRIPGHSACSSPRPSGKRRGSPSRSRRSRASASGSRSSVTLVGDATAYGPEQQEKALGSSKSIARLGLEELVRRLGFCSPCGVARLALKHYLFVAASTTASDGDSEGTPMALVELAATGVILVTTRHADIPEIVSRRRRPGSWPSLLNRDQPHRGARGARSPVAAGLPIGAAARAHISAEFDADHARTAPRGPLPADRSIGRHRRPPRRPHSTPAFRALAEPAEDIVVVGATPSHHIPMAGSQLGGVTDHVGDREERPLFTQGAEPEDLDIPRDDRSPSRGAIPRGVRPSRSSASGSPRPSRLIMAGRRRRRPGATRRR